MFRSLRYSARKILGSCAELAISVTESSGKKFGEKVRGNVVEGVVEVGVEIPSALSIAKQIGTSSRTVQRELAYLQTKGIIRRVGGDFGGHWEIVE